MAKAAGWIIFDSIRRRGRALSFLLLAALSLTALPAYAAGGHEPDEAAIRQQAQEYVRAFEAGDLERLMSFWDDSAIFTDQFGNVLQGKDEIRKDCSRFFSAKSQPALELSIDSITFPGTDTALECGVSRSGAPGSSVQTARYLAFHVKRNGKWLIAGVSESPYAASNASEALKPFKFFLGSWKAEGPNGALSFSLKPENDNVICRKSEFIAKDGSKKSQTEYIYWNPQSGEINSFELDSAGGTGAALWRAAAGGFTVKAVARQSDGRDARAEYLIKRIDDDHFSWQSRHRMLGTEELPDIDQIKAGRQKG